jgi:hypothetical protein
LKDLFIILAVDKEVVDRGVQVKYKDFQFAKDRTAAIGAEYLEKMVQLPLSLFPLHRTQVETFVSKFNPPAALQLHLALLRDTLEPNPRKIKRALNILRARLEERIQQTRAERRAKQFEEMENVRKSAQEVSDERGKRKAMLFGFALSFYALIGGIALFIFNRDYKSSFETSQSLWTILGWPCMAFGFVTLLVSMLRPDLLLTFMPFGDRNEGSRFQELHGPFRSFEQLKNAALSVTAARYEWIDSERMLESKNPYFRFAALIARTKSLNAKLLAQILLQEPCAIIRRLAAQELGKVPVNASDTTREDISELLTSVPETIYYIEVAASKQALPSDSDKRMTTAQRLVSTLSSKVRSAETGTEKRGRDSLASELVFALAQEPDSSRAKALFEAFQTDFEVLARSELESVSLQQIRESLRELSPFDEGGVGTFDELLNVDKFEQLYLFFRQIQFLKERGLLSNRNALDD